MKLPWLKLWTAQALAETISLSLEAKGAWFAILCDLAESPQRGTRAKPVDAWARLLGADAATAARVLDELRRAHVFDFAQTQTGELEIASRTMAKEVRALRDDAHRARRYRATKTAGPQGVKSASRKNHAAEDRSQKTEETTPSRPPLGEVPAQTMAEAAPAPESRGDAAPPSADAPPTGGDGAEAGASPSCDAGPEPAGARGQSPRKRKASPVNAQGPDEAPAQGDGGGASGEDDEGITRAPAAPPPENGALVQLARLFAPQAQAPRPLRERRAWAQIAPPPAPDEVALVQAFYAQPKSRACDETWRRKNALVRLLHEWQEQREAAAAFFAREPWRLSRPKTSAESGAPPEPADWRTTAARLYPHADLSVSWAHLWRHHPEVCREIAAATAVGN